MKTLNLCPATTYLLREAALILGFSYFVLAGGTLNGVMRFHLRLVSHSALAILFLVWLVARLRQGERLARSPLDGAALAFLGVQLLAAVLSTDPRRSLALCGQWIAYALWLYLLCDLLRHGWPAELVVKSLLIVSGILVGLGLVGLAAQWSQWSSVIGDALPLPLLQQRFYSLLGDPNMTAGLLNLLLPLALARLATARSRGAKALLGLWIAAVLFTQLLTCSQGGMAGLVVAVASTSFLLLLAARPARLVERWHWARAHKWPLWLLGLLVASLAVGLLGGLIVAGDLLGARGPLWRAAWQTFLRSPLWGSGPFTFGSQLMLYESTPPYPAYPHAHNYLLNTAAETGLLGLAASAWAVIALGAALRRAWQTAGRAHRALMAGAVGSLLGFAAHSLADNHVILPGIGALVVVALTLALAGDNTPPPRAYRLSIAWLGLPALILAAGSLWSDGAYWRFNRGYQLAQAGEWAGAAAPIERAAQLDPAFAFYHLQSGYVHSVLAAEDTSGRHLAQAIAAYERGIALEPNFSLHHANLASLYWAAGRRDEAIVEMARAAQLAPAGPLYHLNLGYYYEAAGREAEAAAEYERFLALQPHLMPASYWRQTPFRQQFAGAWLAAHPPPPPPPPPETPHTAADYLARGWYEYRAGQYQAALDAFRQAHALDATAAEIAHGLGVTYMALGDYERADSAFIQANFFLVRSSRPEPLLDWGRLAYRQGDVERAIARYESALKLVEEYSIYGPGTLGWSPYGNFLFQRESISRELAPQLVRIDVTDDLAQRYLELGSWYEEQGDVENAVAVYRRLLARAPDLVAAGERLQALENKDTP